MATCTACGHSLIGLPGAPAEQTGVFTADVRCPECGATSRAGVRILVGGSTALAMTRARPLRQRILLSIAFGSGIATVLLHILAAGALWFVIGALVDLAAGGRRFTSPRMLVVLAPCVAVLVAVARFWWKRRPAPHDPDKPAHERDRLLVIGPDGLETRKRRLEPSAVRTIRVAECIGAGDGAVVAAIRPIPMHESRWAPPADELYMAIPAGSAAALADELVGTLRGRQSAASGVGDEIDGDLMLPNFRERALALAALIVAPFTIGLGMWIGTTFGTTLGTVIGAVVALAPPVGLVCATAERFGEQMMRWRFADRGITVEKLNSALLFGPNAVVKPELMGGRAWPSSEIRRLELRESHGVPYLLLRPRRWWRRPARIVPADWLGMNPAVFAAKVAERLRVPLHDRIRA